MKKKLLNKIAYSFASFIQLALIVGVFIINDLTGKKAGVMHHVYYKRHQYEQGIYSLQNLLWQKTLGIVLGIIFVIILMYAIKKRKSTFYKLQIFLAAIISFLIYLIISNNSFINMLAYPYFIMAFELVLLIQIIIVAIMYFKRV